MNIKAKWLEFKTAVYPDGFINAEHEAQIERAFHGGILIGLVLVTQNAAVLRQELEQWVKDERARR